MSRQDLTASSEDMTEYTAVWSWLKAKAMPLHWNHFNHTLSSQWDSPRQCKAQCYVCIVSNTLLNWLGGLYKVLEQFLILIQIKQVFIIIISLHMVGICRSLYFVQPEFSFNSHSKGNAGNDWNPSIYSSLSLSAHEYLMVIVWASV